jgi:pimeloyl-ACP methyl ester carboxylesterase
MLHSTAGIRQLRCYSARGRAFAEAGVATLQFDCRGFGASEGEPRQLLDVRRLAEDLEAAIGLAVDRDELDAGRLGLWGGSASCAQVLDAARRREDVRAVVCLTPFVPGRETQRSAGTPLLRLAAAAAADRVRSALRQEPHGVAVAGAAGETAILVRDDAAAGERGMLPPEARLDRSGERAELGRGTVWENRVVLRPRLRTPHPLRVAAGVTCPVLVISGSKDSLCPPGPAAELANRAPAAELEAFECGHFDLYCGRSIPAEAEFLRRHLRRTSG